MFLVLYIELICYDFSFHISLPIEWMLIASKSQHQGINLRADFEQVYAMMDGIVG